MENAEAIQLISQTNASVLIMHICFACRKHIYLIVYCFRLESILYGSPQIAVHLIFLYQSKGNLFYKSDLLILVHISNDTL